jgi:hypothetical protein
MLGFRMSILEINVPDPQMGPADVASGSQSLDPTATAPRSSWLQFTLQPGYDDFLVAKFHSSAAMTATLQGHDELWLQCGRLYRGNRACQQGSERIRQCSEPVQGHFR